MIICATSSGRRRQLIVSKSASISISLYLHLSIYRGILAPALFVKKSPDKLLTFLYYPGVPPTNNQSEQALRTSVIHRKVTNGFRSDWGANAYANLLSVIATAKIKGQRVFETLANLMGCPVLQFLEASSP